MSPALADGARPGAALDLHEGISDPAGSGCLRWPEHQRLLNTSTGELVRGRCKATNLCSYCAKLAAVENAELLALDALEGSAPALWIVLTTRSADLDPRSFYRARERVWKAVRRRWPDAEYAALVEMTTGYGDRSGGLRRPHWNLLVKGVPLDQEDALAEIVRRVWCSRVDAEPWAQFVGPVSEVGGLLRYIALHFQKESQAPPKGWRGHRFLKSRGYLSGSAAEARDRARQSLRLKRLLHRGFDVQAAELELAAAALVKWELRHVNPSTVDLQVGRAAAVPAPSASALVDRGASSVKVAGVSSPPVTSGGPDG